MTTARPVEQSLFPGHAPDRPRGPIVGSVIGGTNADLIAAIAPLYLTGSVLDVTYGEGGWWKRHVPADFTYHDLHKVDGVDFRDLPHDNRAFNTVCFDPPYVPAGGGPSNRSADEFRDRFGLDWGDGYRSEAVLGALIRDGLTECARVSSRWLLIKCMEFVSSQRFHDMPTTITNWALELGLTKHDQIVHHSGPGPGGHNIFTPIRARRHHSYLLVFEVSA
jgi:hypothetical protein